MNKQVQEYVEIRKKELKVLTENREVNLVVIQVGDDPASNSYIRGKKKDCEEVGINLYHAHFPADIDEVMIMQCIDMHNLNEDCHGIIVQLPLPPHIDVKKVQERIDPMKDVDGFHPMSYFKPCTPMGVISFLRHTKYNFEGKRALVIGRSDIVGKPLAQLLTDLDCTVTLAHSKTLGIRHHIQESDIVFTAIDKIEWFDISFAGSLMCSDCVIDIGLGISSYDHKLHGNLSGACVEALKDVIPVLSGIKGVGLLTRLQLVENTIMASILNGKED